MLQQVNQQPNIYKRLFWGLVILDILFAIAMLWSVNEKRNFIDQKQTQIVSADSANELKGDLDSTLSKIDSLRYENAQLMVEIGRPDLRDTINLSDREKRILALSDSIFRVKDSIDLIRIFMNDSISLKELSENEKDIYFKTINTLGIIKIKLDLTLDKQRLELLKKDSKDLEVIIQKFDSRREQLRKLTKQLKSVTKIIKTTIDILMAAAKENIIVAPGKALTK